MAAVAREWAQLMRGVEVGPGLDLAAVIELVAPGGVLLRSWPLIGGGSAAMTGLELRQADGRVSRLVVRQYERTDRAASSAAARREFRLLQSLDQAGLAVPAVRGLAAGGQMLGEPFLVLAYVEGAAEFAPADLDGYLGHMAGQLAAIHGLDVGALGLDFLPMSAQGCAELADWAQWQLGSQAGGMRYGGGLRAEEIARVLAEYGRVEGQNEVALLHGDFWPGNVLWRDGEPAAVIDWEDAMIGDPLLDLAIARLDIGWIFGLEAMEGFTERYLVLTATDTTALPYWDLCAAVRLARLVGDDMAGWLAFFEPFGRSDLSAAGLLADYDAFCTQALAGLAAE